MEPLLARLRKNERKAFEVRVRLRRSFGCECPNILEGEKLVSHSLAEYRASE